MTTKTMRAWVLDPLTATIHERDVPSGEGFLKAAYELIGCSLVDRARIDRNLLAWVDDEGLLNGSMERVGAFKVPHYGQPLTGRTVITAYDTDEEGWTMGVPDGASVEKLLEGLIVYQPMLPGQPVFAKTTATLVSKDRYEELKLEAEK